MTSQTTMRCVAGLAAVLAMSLPAAAQARPAPQPLGPRLQAILDRAVKAPATTAPGMALYVHVPGRGTWTAAAGKANVRTGAPMRASARIRAGSILKPFVAAATLQLVEDGRFGLDDPLPAVLPARVLARFPEAGRITVRMLLN